MISKSPEDRGFYEPRMKFLHDAEGRLIAARTEGREEGAATGRVVGKIQMLQEFLGEIVAKESDLLELELEELSRRLSQLRFAICFLAEVPGMGVSLDSGREIARPLHQLVYSSYGRGSRARQLSPINDSLTPEFVKSAS